MSLCALLAQACYVNKPLILQKVLHTMSYLGYA